MAHKKAGGSTKNNRDSNPKYLGVKVNHGEKASVGEILVRQRGTNVLPGNNVSMGKDHTLFALKEGTVKISKRRKTHFDRSLKVKKEMNIV